MSAKIFARSQEPGARVGTPQLAKGNQHTSVPWRPASIVPYAEPDTLMLLQPTDEAQVLSEGGRLHQLIQTYFTQVRAALGVGPFTGKSFPQDSDGATHAVYPIDGAFPTDEFTVAFWAKSKALDFRSQTGTGYLLSIRDESGDRLRVQGTPSNGQISARFILGGVPGPEALATLSIGDWPADTWRSFSVTFKAGTLTIMFGNNVRSGSAAGVSSRTDGWASSGAYGVMPVSNGDAAGTVSGPYEVADIHIRRFARTYNTQLSYKGPTVTVDASTSLGAFPDKQFGVFAQYPGWRDQAADGQTGGGGPGVAGTAVRDALIAAQTAAGLKFVRIDHLFDKATITGTYPNYTYDWSKLTAPMDLLAAAGCKFHLTLGFCPALLGATLNTPPSDNTAFARMCSDALTFFKARYGSSAIVTVSLWNEPDSTSFFNGTKTQFTDLWQAVRSRLATDHPDLPLGLPDAGGATTDTGARGMFRAVLDVCQANGYTPGCALTHLYYSSPGLIGRELKTVRDYLIANIVGGATVPVGVTEWNLDQSNGAQRHDASGASAGTMFGLRNDYRSEYQAAFAHAAMAAAIGSGASVGAYTRMGILDSFFSGSQEEEMGLFTNDSPPRPLPVYGAFQAMWKHAGNRVTATTNFPYLRALASKATNGGIVLTYSTFRRWRSSDRIPVGIEWAGLPEKFTWKQYRLDSRDAAEGRLVLIAEGTEANIPLSADLGALGVGCIEVAPQ